MNILMITNAYLPHVGGVARSVKNFKDEFLKRGHKVLVVSPSFDGEPQSEEDVLRIPSIKNYKGSKFSIPFTLFTKILSRVEAFRADIVHSQHPFLLGNTAMRIAHHLDIPLVFTYHTRYEHYSHYLPVNLKNNCHFIESLVMGYLDLCDHVVVPSKTIYRILKKRGIKKPLSIIPTGLSDEFKLPTRLDKKKAKQRLNINPKTFLIGHLGRLSPEKNLYFLMEAICSCVQKNKDIRAIIGGEGILKNKLERIAYGRQCNENISFPGVLKGEALENFYKAIDLFLFSSKTETQGLVLVESMSFGTPILALSAPGVNDVVRDSFNGKLIKKDNPQIFAEAILGFKDSCFLSEYSQNSRISSEKYKMETCGNRMLKLYKKCIRKKSIIRKASVYKTIEEDIKIQFKLLKNFGKAALEIFNF